MTPRHMTIRGSLRMTAYCHSQFSENPQGCPPLEQSENKKSLKKNYTLTMDSKQKMGKSIVMKYLQPTFRRMSKKMNK